MALSDAQKRATAKYMKTHLDDIKIRVPKGNREKIRKIALEKGFNGIQPYIKFLISKDSGLNLD